MLINKHFGGMANLRRLMISLHLCRPEKSKVIVTVSCLRVCEKERLFTLISSIICGLPTTKVIGTPLCARDDVDEESAIVGIS